MPYDIYQLSLLGFFLCNIISKVTISIVTTIGLNVPIKRVCIIVVEYNVMNWIINKPFKLFQFKLSYENNE